jgi:hypothetical protein
MQSGNWANPSWTRFELRWSRTPEAMPLIADRSWLVARRAPLMAQETYESDVDVAAIEPKERNFAESCAPSPAPFGPEQFRDAYREERRALIQDKAATRQFVAQGRPPRSRYRLWTSWKHSRRASKPPANLRRR